MCLFVLIHQKITRKENTGERKRKNRKKRGDERNFEVADININDKVHRR